MIDIMICGKVFSLLSYNFSCYFLYFTVIFFHVNLSASLPGFKTFPRAPREGSNTLSCPERNIHGARLSLKLIPVEISSPDMPCFYFCFIKKWP